jgi:hypothetical protein
VRKFVPRNELSYPGRILPARGATEAQRKSDRKEMKNQTEKLPEHL